MCTLRQSATESSTSSIERPAGSPLASEGRCDQGWSSTSRPFLAAVRRPRVPGKRVERVSQACLPISQSERKPTHLVDDVDVPHGSWPKVRVGDRQVPSVSGTLVDFDSRVTSPTKATTGRVSNCVQQEHDQRSRRTYSLKSSGLLLVGRYENSRSDGPDTTERTPTEGPRINVSVSQQGKSARQDGSKGRTGGGSIGHPHNLGLCLNVRQPVLPLLSRLSPLGRCCVNLVVDVERLLDAGHLSKRGRPRSLALRG